MFLVFYLIKFLLLKTQNTARVVKTQKIAASRKTAYNSVERHHREFSTRYSESTFKIVQESVFLLLFTYNLVSDFSFFPELSQNRLRSLKINQVPLVKSERLE